MFEERTCQHDDQWVSRFIWDGVLTNCINDTDIFLRGLGNGR